MRDRSTLKRQQQKVKQRERRRQKRRERTALSLCRECGSPELKNKHYCALHASRRTVEKARRKERLRTQGLCSSCGRNPLKTAWLCGPCCLKEKDRVRRARENNKANGLCVCGRQPRENGNKCDTCWLRDKAQEVLGRGKEWVLLLDLLEKQQFRCAYTGESLVLGVNASIDHIIPVCAGGKDSIDNLQFVTRRINSMKSDCSHDEFIRLCKLVALNN